MSDRQELLERVANEILQLPSTHVRRIGVDGVDGAGKTVFADELAVILTRWGTSVIRASADGFHNPRDVRYRLGRHSPEGFFHDSYNYDKLKEFLLDPLSPQGSMCFRRAVYDIHTELAVEAPDERGQPGAILVFDGIFLHRRELRTYWDYSVFLQVSFEISIPRGAQRGMGSADPEALSNRRYVQGQQIYLRDSNPRAQASIVINNEDLAAPFVVA